MRSAFRFPLSVLSRASAVHAAFAERPGSDVPALPLVRCRSCAVARALLLVHRDGGGGAHGIPPCGRDAFRFPLSAFRAVAGV
ncbi:MAG TPA: hypothetical protein RMH80_07700, partial [Polyangiaceae bacterium LLY-WYZ-15_(1-7)]|nr:hypothetical protein [Polyangiaceae bacterium LLY-WYZ-15_(1-7)]